MRASKKVTEKRNDTHTEKQREMTKTSDCDLSLFFNWQFVYLFKNCCWFSDATETHARFCGYYDFLCVSFFLPFCLFQVQYFSKDWICLLSCVRVCVYILCFCRRRRCYYWCCLQSICSKNPLIAHFSAEQIRFCSFAFPSSVWFHSFHGRTHFRADFMGPTFHLPFFFPTLICYVVIYLFEMKSFEESAHCHCVHIKMGILFPNHWKLYVQCTCRGTFLTVICGRFCSSFFYFVLFFFVNLGWKKLPLYTVDFTHHHH